MHYLIHKIVSKIMTYGLKMYRKIDIKILNRMNNKKVMNNNSWPKWDMALKGVFFRLPPLCQGVKSQTGCGGAACI